MSNNIRKGPSQSATEFKVGSRKKGNDGSTWEIIKTKTGVKRWQRINKKSSKKPSKKSTKKKIQSFRKRKRSKSSRKSRKSKKGSQKRRLRIIEEKWKKAQKKRDNELKDIKTTRSYIPITKLTSKNGWHKIHDNGGRPFEVQVNNKAITVYTFKDETEAKQKGNYSKQVAKFNKFLGYFSGYDITPYKFHGNSLLVQLSKHEYVFIGWMIYRFKTDDIILDYVSPVGNSDVPYPVAYGENNIYFMLDQKMIRRDELETPITFTNAEKLYGEFYGHSGYKKHKKFNMKSVKVLVKRRW